MNRCRFMNSPLEVCDRSTSGNLFANNILHLLPIPVEYGRDVPQGSLPLVLAAAGEYEIMFLL